MKRKLPYILLLLEFAAVLSVELLTRELPQWFSSLLAFPIEQTGMALRALGCMLGVAPGLSYCELHVFPSFRYSL